MEAPRDREILVSKDGMWNFADGISQSETFICYMAGGSYEARTETTATIPR